MEKTFGGFDGKNPNFFIIEERPLPKITVYDQKTFPVYSI
jgi:hypothetical protein